MSAWAGSVTRPSKVSPVFMRRPETSIAVGSGREPRATTVMRVPSSVGLFSRMPPLTTRSITVRPASDTTLWVSGYAWPLTRWYCGAQLRMLNPSGFAARRVSTSV